MKRTKTINSLASRVSAERVVDQLREQKEAIEADRRAVMNEAWARQAAEKLRKEIRDMGHDPCA